MIDIKATPTEAQAIVMAIITNCIDGQLRQDIGYLAKIMADARKLAVILEEKNDGE